MSPPKVKVTLDRVFEQASDTSHGCDHVELTMRSGDAGAIQCVRCGKRWCPTLRKVKP